MGSPATSAPSSSPSRDWRRAQAREADVAAFVIFNDATLRSIAASKPRNRTELLAVSGVGPVKAQRFGDDVLAIVARHR
ncbi:MAG: HRDC domain-containing protein [Microthrixaceae bacterium]